MTPSRTIYKRNWQPYTKIIFVACVVALLLLVAFILARRKPDLNSTIAKVEKVNLTSSSFSLAVTSNEPLKLTAYAATEPIGNIVDPLANSQWTAADEGVEGSKFHFFSFSDVAAEDVFVKLTSDTGAEYSTQVKLPKYSADTKLLTPSSLVGSVTDYSGNPVVSGGLVYLKNSSLEAIIVGPLSNQGTWSLEYSSIDADSPEDYLVVSTTDSGDGSVPFNPNRASSNPNVRVVNENLAELVGLVVGNSENPQKRFFEAKPIRLSTSSHANINTPFVSKLVTPISAQDNEGPCSYANPQNCDEGETCNWANGWGKQCLAPFTAEGQQIKHEWVAFCEGGRISKAYSQRNDNCTQENIGKKLENNYFDDDTCPGDATKLITDPCGCGGTAIVDTSGNLTCGGGPTSGGSGSGAGGGTGSGGSGGSGSGGGAETPTDGSGTNNPLKLSVEVDLGEASGPYLIKPQILLGNNYIEAPLGPLQINLRHSDPEKVNQLLLGNKNKIEINIKPTETLKFLFLYTPLGSSGPESSLRTLKCNVGLFNSRPGSGYTDAQLFLSQLTDPLSPDYIIDPGIAGSTITVKSVSDCKEVPPLVDVAIPVDEDKPTAANSLTDMLGRGEVQCPVAPHVADALITSTSMSGNHGGINTIAPQNATDIRVPFSNDLFAPVDGVVAFVNYPEDTVKFWSQQDANGDFTICDNVKSNGKKYYDGGIIIGIKDKYSNLWRYAHLENVNLKSGQSVQKGVTIIGRVFDGKFENQTYTNAQGQTVALSQFDDQEPNQGGCYRSAGNPHTHFSIVSANAVDAQWYTGNTFNSTDFTKAACAGIKLASYLTSSGQDVNLKGNLIGSIHADEIASAPNLKTTVGNGIDVTPPQPGRYNIKINGKTSATAAVDITSSSLRVCYFVDSNNNGSRDNSELCVDNKSAESFQVEYEKIAEPFTYKLDKGWNLIGLPFLLNKASKTGELKDKVGTSASDLYKQIERGNLQKYQGNQINLTLATLEGSESYSVYTRVNTQNKKISPTESSVMLGKDFSLIPGRAIFVYTNQPLDLKLFGNEYTSVPMYNLGKGWNLLNLYDKHNLRASEIIKQGMNSREVLQMSIYSGGFQTLKREEGSTEQYGNDFPLLKDRGYFVFVK